MVPESNRGVQVPTLVVWDLQSDQTATTAMEFSKFSAAGTWDGLSHFKASLSHSQDPWETHRTEIAKLYKSSPLSSVISTMETKHSFYATPKQYKDRFSKWGLDKKNVKTKEMDLILRKVVRRQNEGKDTHVLLHGKQVPQSKVKRALRLREAALNLNFIDDEDPGPSNAIVCRTPPAIRPRTQPRSPSPLDALAMALLRPVQYTNHSSPLFALCFSHNTVHNPVSKRLSLATSVSFEGRNLNDLIDLGDFVAGLQSVEEESLLQGRFRQGEEETLLHELLVVHRDGNISDSANLSATLDELGSIFQAQSRWKAAEIVLLRAALVQYGSRGDTHLATLKTLSQLAEVLNRQFRHLEAQDFYKFAWSGQLASSEDRGFYDGLESMLGLSGVSINLNKLREAQQLQEELLDNSKVIGEAHPTIVKGMSLVAKSHSARGRYNDAAILQRRVLSSTIQIYGEESPETLEVLSDLADYEERIGNYAIVYTSLLQIQRLTRSVLGDEHDYKGRAIIGLAYLFNQQKQFDIALEHGLNNVAFFESKFSDGHVGTLLSKFCILKSYLGLGQIHLAKTLCVELLPAFKKFFSERQGHALVFLRLVSREHFAPGKLDMAQQLLLEAIEGAEGNVINTHPMFENCRERLLLLKSQLELIGQEV